MSHKMNTNLPKHLAHGYKSLTQIARVVTEGWVSDNMYCLACDSAHLLPTKPGMRVVDFLCDSCDEQYQLKSLSKPFGRRVLDGEFHTMLDAIRADRTPNFLFLHYIRDAWKVQDLFSIPAHFFSPSILERRKPLGPTARRAGWEGCNILLDRLPSDGRISIIENGEVRGIEDVRSEWHRFSFLRETSWRARGWTSDVLACVRRLRKKDFTLQEMYGFEDELSELHPANMHIRPKIRQQLQVLRDRQILKFEGRGTYKLIE